MSDAIYTDGEYEVRLTQVKDTRIPDPGISTAYGIWHAPTGVLTAVSTVLSSAIRGANALNTDLKEARDNPSADPQPFGSLPFGGGFGAN